MVHFLECGQERKEILEFIYNINPMTLKQYHPECILDILKDDIQEIQVNHSNPCRGPAELALAAWACAAHTRARGIGPARPGPFAMSGCRHVSRARRLAHEGQ